VPCIQHFPFDWDFSVSHLLLSEVRSQKSERPLAGVAFQLTNIARDVGEVWRVAAWLVLTAIYQRRACPHLGKLQLQQDARNGRVYLPEKWLREEVSDKYAQCCM
jgi:hypothetical protein